MNSLKEKIIEKIKKEGPITFESYMEIVLYYPELGYYATPKTTIGRKGDFYTSPHLHPIFGAMIGKQLMEMWIVMGKPSDFHAVEIGAGAGYLCKDIYDYLNRTSKTPFLTKEKNDFLKSLRYVIVEPYLHIEQMQRGLLKDYINNPALLPSENRSTETAIAIPTCRDEKSERRSNLIKSTKNEKIATSRRVGTRDDKEETIKWVKSLHELKEITGCIFSNELLDAFPVHLVEMEDNIKEIYVAFDGKDFMEEKNKINSEDIADYIKQFSINIQPGYRTEINLRIRNWLEDIAVVLSYGFILTIDYGYSAGEYYSEERTKGTLLCYHKHLFNEDPYQNIGEQDITAHVNFSSLKKWGEEIDLKTIGYCPQGTYLTSSGIDEVISELYSDSPDYLYEISKIKGLIMPQGMGESHSVIIQYKGEGLPELRGFSMRNLTNNL